MQKFDVIYADPPWAFKTYSNKGKAKSPENHYKCLSIQDIYDLPIDQISSENSILFLWVTFPLLQEGLKTIEKWGFTYKTCAFNWVKRNKKSNSWFWGLGFWTRSNSEICLLGTKGNPKRVSKSVHQVCDDRVMEHSKKPDCIRDRIVELCGDVPRMELFARKQSDGWVCLGDEINGKDIRDELQLLIQ